MRLPSGKKRNLLIAAVAVVGTLAILQLLLPALAERQIEDRLTANGGTASVSVSAFPSLRLLFGNGSELSAQGEDLEIDPAESENVRLDRLDGFDRVEIRIDRLTSGPLALDSFELRRDGSEPYRVTMAGTTTSSAAAEFAAAELEGFAGLLADAAVRGAADLGLATEEEIPIEIDVELESDGGGINVVYGEGTIAGFPAGPLIEIITATVVDRL